MIISKYVEKKRKFKINKRNQQFRILITEATGKTTRDDAFTDPLDCAKTHLEFSKIA